MTGANVGCGCHPIRGWINIDNSPTVLLKRLPLGGLLPYGPRTVWQAAREYDITRANATRLPILDRSVDSVYSSHMLEHLDRKDAERFLDECRRVLKPNGWLRISVPDLAIFVTEYIADRDADRFLGRVMLTHARRGHQWMYDARSLSRLLRATGFPEPKVVPPGETNLVFKDGLDTFERQEESFYVEAQPG